MPHQIVFADEYLLAVSKPAGMASQPTRSGDRSLLEALEGEAGARLHVVHRIDQPISGLVLFARDSGTAAALSEAFRSRAVERIYWATVGTPPAEESGTLKNRLQVRPGANKTVTSKSGGKSAELQYQVINQSERYWLLDIRLVTGRHHQIRAQLAAIGCPVRGDLKYGFPRSIRGGGIGLHARQLEFDHPATRQKVRICAPAPADPLWEALTAGHDPCEPFRQWASSE